MNDLAIVIPIAWVRYALWSIGSAGTVFGLFSFLSPGRSIRLYQKMMALFNWRVEPVDERREIQTTRLLGVLMTVLSGAILLSMSRLDRVLLLW